MPNFIALGIYFIFGTKFSWVEGIDTCFNVECMLLDLILNFWWLLSSYCSLPVGYWWLLLVTACYHSLLLVPTISMNVRCCLTCSDLLINKMLCSWKCFNDTSCEKFVIFSKKYPWRSLMLRKLQYVESQFFRSAPPYIFLRNLRTIQRK